MTAPMAFRATYADWKLIKTRGVVQVVMEVPLADSDAAYDVLGGMPNAANESWFAIAPLTIPPAAKEAKRDADLTSVKPLPESDKPSAGAKRNWRDLQPSQQAGIRCEEPAFKAFLDECHCLADWNNFTTASAVRALCSVKSRADLNTNHAARVIWHQLDTEYQGWLAKERVGA